jgi:hypothetical protein
MKTQLLLISFAIVLFTNCKSKKISENVKLDLIFTMSSDYCGGAAPTEEILESITSSKPFINGTFYLVLKNDGGTILSETMHKTDEKGKLTLNLKKGMYEIFLLSAEQKKLQIMNLDEKFRSCSTIFYDQPQAYLHAWQKGEQKVDIHSKCNPCLPPAP